MAVAAHYNARPSNRGPKQNIFVRILRGLFPWPGDGAIEIVRKIIFIVALGCFVYFGGSVALDLLGEARAGMVHDELNDMIVRDHINIEDVDPVIRQEVEAKDPNILPEFMAAYNENNDLVGQISIPDVSGGFANITSDKDLFRYPVFQTIDNKYYLDHTPDGKYSKGGSIFADFRNQFKPALSGNTILYGHNILTGAYFAKLSRYYTGTDLAFYKKHPIVSFDTIYERSDWKIFATVLFNTQAAYGEVYDYTNMLDFRSADEFNTFVLDLMDRSVLFTDVDLQYGDNILTLSTCYYPYGEQVDTRVVVFARKVRPGESSEVNVDKASYNSKELRFAEQKRRIGSNWDGRVWDTSYLKSYQG